MNWLAINFLDLLSFRWELPRMKPWVPLMLQVPKKVIICMHLDKSGKKLSKVDGKKPCICEIIQEREIFSLSKEKFKFRVDFERDINIYYITHKDEVVWYDNFAKPISFGIFTNSTLTNYLYEIQWSNLHFYMDSNYTNWQKTNYDVMMIVGKLTKYWLIYFLP